MLIEIRKILRGRYIPGEKDHFDEEEYCMELNQAYISKRKHMDIRCEYSLAARANIAVLLQLYTAKNGVFGAVRKNIYDE